MFENMVTKIRLQRDRICVVPDDLLEGVKLEDLPSTSSRCAESLTSTSQTAEGWPAQNFRTVPPTNNMTKTDLRH